MWSENNKVKGKENTITKKGGVTKNSERSKLSRMKMISKYIKFYCHYSTLNGLKYLANSRRPWFERILWIIILNLIISVLVIMVYISCQEFVTTPLLTSMETDTYKTTDLSFPGIAICSINRISQQSAINLATDIFNAKISNQSVDEIRNLIMDLGSLYASVFKINVNRNEELEKLLNTYYNGSYDVTNLMKDLTPKCSVMLLKCKLHGFDKNCSDIFEFRKTQDGYCCTFNYVRESDDILELNDTIKLIDTIKVMDLGIERGLTVVMDPLLDDYFYPTIPIKGWKVIVFNPTDYPDMTSGGVTEILAMPLSETFMDITTTAFLSTQIIESFPRNERNCIFTHETHTTNDGTMYTYSDCIVDCKIDSIQESCGCRPFIYPRRGRNQC
ncbi:sodium channel protein Nach-like isoform X1 [Solenopsis invicta]|uniref:sodium channel protein Nach-like isoform X1 n=1 Tax=Solenopsis invicta TaxID=13686 RepID=UPI00193DE654|nr:sodium channel protein Nach-like isoform X1 [Solenopsis invicta]